MNLLFLCQRFPCPPDRGDRIRSFHTIRHLAKRHQVTVGCVTNETTTDENLSALRDIVHDVHVGQLSQTRWLRAMASVACGGSATEAAFCSSTLMKTLDAKLSGGEFDAAFVFCSSMWPYVAKHVENIKTIVDLVDVDSQKWLDLAKQTKGPKSLIYGLEGKRTRKLEARIARQAPLIVVSQRESDILQEFAPHATCHVIGNGVDGDYFYTAAPSPIEATAPRCVFVGVQNYEPNIDAIEWFCREVWPSVKQASPAAQLDIVGKSPAPRVEALAAGPDVHVTGSVPDVRPYLEEATVVIAPLRVARGIQNKVLEAMSMARAIVASPQALDGIDAAGPPAARASTPNEWTQAIVDLFTTPERRHQLEKQGPEFVGKHFRWETNATRIESLL